MAMPADCGSRIALVPSLSKGEPPRAGDLKVATTLEGMLNVS